MYKGNDGGMRLQKMRAILIILAIGIVFMFAYKGKQVQAANKKEDTGTYNLLLIGVDRRGDFTADNADVMMLATVNEEEETIFLTSFLRDLYADIPGYGVQKLNAACAIGGPELCVETLVDNYHVEIDNYIMVDFSAMIDIVEEIGGVEIKITKEERKYINKHVAEVCKQNGEDPKDHKLKKSGKVVLDGYQALTFARDRTTGNTYDFGRTKRQRKLIKAILEEMKEDQWKELVDIAPKIIKDAEHDLGKFKILNLTLQIPKWMGYEIEQQRVPFDNEYYIENEILIPYDMQDTIEKIRDTIY